MSRILIVSVLIVCLFLATCQSASDCSSPAVTGMCEALFPRWYFSTGTRRCERFIWGGCGGNANNYETEADCIKACGHA